MNEWLILALLVLAMIAILFAGFAYLAYDCDEFD
jgi:hypothetical protein